MCHMLLLGPIARLLLDRTMLHHCGEDHSMAVACPHCTHTLATVTLFMPCHGHDIEVFMQTTLCSEA